MCWTKPDQTGEHEKDELVNTSSFSAQIFLSFQLAWVYHGYVIRRDSVAPAEILILSLLLSVALTRLNPSSTLQPVFTSLGLFGWGFCLGLFLQ